MNTPRVLSALAVATATALAVLGGGAPPATYSAPIHQAGGPTAPRTFTMYVGYGNDDWAANVYSPHKINIYVGDSITWVNRGKLEPHTITFGPMKLLKQLAAHIVLATPQKAGPPQLQLNPQLGLPTHRRAYNGAGYANSGFLRQGQLWTITFSRAGTYTYYCLVHFPGMTGIVVVHPRPTDARTLYVRTGYGSNTSAADVFFPDVLTVHAGSTVVWQGAVFHTVTFAPIATIAQLRKQFIIPVPQRAGPPMLSINPRVAFPTGGTVYDGTGMLSSGILQPPHNTFAVTFTKPGVYHYGCLVHPGMDGTIRVIP